MDAWYPTRLVERISDEIFRVVRSDSGSFRRGKRYITLSHKWGTGDFLRLSTNNISILEKGLPIKSLRKTFQDTLTVAHRLKIPYVWIDSLCIIQSGDDFEDWRRESQTMTKVYSNSFCNISADYGDEENGLFYQRHGSDFELPYKIQVRWKAEKNELWKKRSKGTSPEATQASSGLRVSPSELETCYIVRRTHWKENLAISPLNRRGWVMQERLLAPRVLSFTPRLVSWDCGQTESTEIWPRRAFDTNFMKLLGKYLDLRDLSWVSKNSTQFHSQRHWREQDAGPLITWWYRLVQDYTGCELTNESDRLVAIAGVAKKLYPIVRDQYVAGLWAGSLPWALAWLPYPRDRRQYDRRQSTGYHSPTFSWAACPGRVRVPFYSLPWSDEATLLLAAAFIKYRSNRLPPIAAQWSDDILITDNVFGPLRSPEVEVQARGILRSCRLTTRGTGSDSDLKVTAYPSSSIKACWTIPQAPEKRSDIRGTMDHEIDPDDLIRATFYYAIIIVDGRHHKRKAEGLLLESVDARMGRFKRVGYIHQRYLPGDTLDLLRPLGNEGSIPAWSFDEAKGEHNFYIV